jgi:hypothetical protein
VAASCTGGEDEAAVRVFVALVRSALDVYSGALKICDGDGCVHAVIVAILLALGAPQAAFD